MVYIIGLLILGILFILGLEKCHIRQNLAVLSRKEKYVTVMLGVIAFLISLFWIAYSEKNMQMEEFYSAIFNHDSSIVMVVKTVCFLIPAMFLISLLLKELCLLLFKSEVQIYYFAIVVFFDYTLVKVVNKSIVEALVLLTLFIFLYCFVICIKEKFPIKKVIYCLLLLGIVGFVSFWSKSIPVQSLYVCGVDLILGIFCGGILKYLRLLRVPLRKAVTIFVLAIFWLIQFMI